MEQLSCVECSTQRLDIHRDTHRVFAAASQHPAEWAHIAEIPTERDCDVLIGGQHIVCGIEINPASLWTKY